MAGLIIRAVDLVWGMGMQNWSPELEHPRLLQRIRQSGLAPFLRTHPNIVFIGRMALAAMRRARRPLMLLKPGHST